MQGAMTAAQSFELTLQQGHQASRELLVVGICAFAISLLFAILLYNKTKAGQEKHAYRAINLNDSHATEEEDAFGDLVDDFNMFDEHQKNETSFDNYNDDAFDDLEDSNDLESDDDLGFDGF